ncbi:MAG: 2-oxo-4-hydroxy-4-carboxy-5-ureidoimidazoline decarboxylase [Bacteroidota bacterium]
MTLDELNHLGVHEASATLTRCCGSSRWVARMVERRPFSGETELVDEADRIWQSLSTDDWIDAFSHHPKIGATGSGDKKFERTRGWSSEEQAGVQNAPESALRALADANREYEQKFGYIFIVCATGKNEREISELLQRRLKNDARTEIAIAAEEQRKITRLRLEKLLKSPA